MDQEWPLNWKYFPADIMDLNLWCQMPRSLGSQEIRTTALLNWLCSNNRLVRLCCRGHHATKHDADFKE